MINRKTLLLVMLLPVSLLLGSEAGLALFHQAFVNAAQLVFDRPVVELPGHLFTVGGATYEVDFWCTPAFLWAGASLLLYLTRSGFGDYWRALAIALPLGALAMAANVVMSIALHQRGTDWTWAHYPGLVLIYGGALFFCQRQPRTSAAALAAQPGV